MILDNIQSLGIIRESEKAPQWVKEAREQHKKLKALVDGTDFKEHLITKIEKIESEKRKQARKNFSRSIIDLNERILRPLDNIYSATGGTKDYQIKSDNEKKDFINLLSSIRDGKSLEQWLAKSWAKGLYHTDPNGVIFLEYLKDVKVYPTYKSINNIRNYKANGQKLEWILFEPEKLLEQKAKALGLNPEARLVRIVDDKTDRTYIEDGETYRLFDDLTFNHPFGEVSGLINSDLIEPGQDVRLSPLHNILEAQEEYARDQSVLSLYKYTKLFPVLWRYDMLCPTCRGQGKVDEKTCPQCGGDKFMNKRDVTDEITLPIPTATGSYDENNNVKIAPDVMGWVSPDLETAEYYKNELKNQEIDMYETLWGSHKSKIEGANENKTATEIWLDTQPVMNKLNDYSKVAAFMETVLTEWIANWKLPKKKSEKIASISYGTRFIIDPPDELLNRYINAKDKGAPTVILDRMLHEYITSKYKNDPETLRMELIKKELEPYVHFSLKEVAKIFDRGEATRKALFVDWWETKDIQDIKTKSFESLETDRDTYIKQRQVEQ